MDTTLQDPLVGHVLDGRYRIDARIAVGGMATVYRAVDIRLDRVLALKVMHPALAADASFVDRFIREAKSVARLSHPNVVGVYDQGTDGSYVYLAMEYIAGCTLRDVLRERGALQPRAALDILEPVLAALGAAHRAGFVHRDMKPENVLIGDDGRVKVADFGLVRAVDTVTSTTGSVLGTVSYLAPEQIENGATDTRVDVYACGVVLYEMLTGAKPHTGGSPAQVLYQHLHEDVPAPSAIVPGLPFELDELVTSATARTPAMRPHDAVALLGRTRATRAALTDEQLDAVPPQARAEGHDASEDRTSVIPRAVRVQGSRAAGSVPDDGVSHTSRLEMPPAGPPGPAAPAGRRPRRAMIAVVTAVLLALGLGAGVWYINSGQFTRVPSLLGQTEQEARKRLVGAGLDVKAVKRGFSDSFARGTVMNSDPASGARIRGNDSVTLTISRGPEIVKVPDVTGEPLARAKRELQDTGLAAGIVSREFSEEVPQGSVIRTDPDAGAKRKPDSAVALVVSKGSPVEVPGVVGETVDDAKAGLEDAGFKVEIAAGQVNSAEKQGTVAKQSTAEGSEAARGDTITLTVSKGPRMLPVPDVTGQSVDDAKSELESAGFEVKVDRPFLSFSDTIERQSAEGGSQAPEGSTITIRTKGL
ncbi:Stk1 family PASTA domain-containing Ser/Thr kinase [Streptomyces sp. NPDC051219]|uniref:Stk1 family PASTA domain-containing Ser/Thr kinase n=1 Tax=Streptomyces sp. NPDC051219 TaxID=3155283 RepID=UPI00342D0ED5